MVLSSMAAGAGVLTENEREMGVVLADIGAGTTDIAIFIEGSVWHTAVLPVGGHHLTNDVAICLRTPFEEAEQIKKKHGDARPGEVPEEEELEIAAFGEQVRQRHLAGLVHEQVVEALIKVLVGKQPRLTALSGMAAGASSGMKD